MPGHPGAAASATARQGTESPFGGEPSNPAIQRRRRANRSNRGLPVPFPRLAGGPSMVRRGRRRRRALLGRGARRTSRRTAATQVPRTADSQSIPATRLVPPTWDSIQVCQCPGPLPAARPKACAPRRGSRAGGSNWMCMPLKIQESRCASPYRKSASCGLYLHPGIEIDVESRTDRRLCVGDAGRRASTSPPYFQ